jgi:hypothetical protein
VAAQLEADVRVGFWRRFFAYMIDLVLIYVPLFIGDFALRSLVTDPLTRSNLQYTLGWSFGLLLFAGYFVGLWMTGGTVGQRMLGFQVVGQDGRAKVSEALTRLIALVVVQIAFFSIIGFLLFAGNRMRGRPYWHDTVSRTRVLRSGRTGPIAA